MSIKAVITTLILATSSAAMASPAVTVHAEASWNVGYNSSRPVVVRDHRYERDYRQPTYRQPSYRQPGWERPYYQPTNFKLNSDSSEYTGPIFSAQPGWGWTALTEPTRIEMSRQIIRVNGRFHNLMLQNVAGSSQIKMVKVRFRDGHTQTIPVNDTLSGSRSSLYLQVQPGDIDFIVVYGTSNRGSAYRVLGN